jgi:hypothetical protein
MAPDEKPTGHPVPRVVWRSTRAVGGIFIVVLGAAGMTVMWLLLH